MNLQSRDDFVNLMQEILMPLRPLYTTGKAGIVIGDTAAHYDGKAVLMEAFSRPLWALVPFWAGQSAAVRGEDPKTPSDGDTAAKMGSGSETWAEIVRAGLIHGTDPENEEYWGDCKPFDQRFVEMAAISYGILYAPEVVWEPLTESQKQNLVTYLNHINEYELPVCNWLMFAVLVNIALRSVGREYRPDMLERYLNDCETFYLGDGWYQDGDSGQKDYYVSFAIHFYNMIYADRCMAQDPERAKLLQERACTFAKTFVTWFDEGGASLPYGRSLTYRFSQVAFFSACVLTGLEPLPLPVMKGLIVRHLEDWLQYPIFDRDHVLTIGFGYPNLVMAERYNAPGSPYWAMKTFAILALPEDHPFWKAEAAPLPEMNGGHALPYADMYVYHYGSHTTGFVPGKYSPNGHGQLPAKYGKFAYDSRFGVSMAKSCYELHENCPDNMLAFVIDGYTYVRRICEEGKILENGVYSRWSPYPGITVETTVIPNENGHIRTHKITSRVACTAYDCGFAISRDQEKYHTDIKDGRAVAMNTFSCCEVTGKSTCTGEIINADPNTNLWWNKTVIPAVRYEIPAGVSELTTEVSAEYHAKQN